MQKSPSYSTSGLSRRAILARAGLIFAATASSRLPGQTIAQDATPSPSLGSEQRVAINGVELYIVERGDPLGTPVVLLHGGLGNTENWNLVWPYLAEAGYRVILLDSRSQGRSGWSEEPVTFELMASDVIGVLDHLQIEQTDLLGWSDGAIVSLVLAMNQSDRLKRVVAYGANFTPDGLTTHSSSAAFNDLVAQLAADYQQLSPQPERFEELLAQLGGLYAVAPDFSDEQLGAIETPFLILDGAADDLVRHDQPIRLAELIPGAQLVIIPGTGHFAPLEIPEEFARIVLAFLAGELVGSPTP